MIRKTIALSVCMVSLLFTVAKARDIKASDSYLSTVDAAATAPAIPYPVCPLQNDYVVWTYGTGNPGTGQGELMGPHSAEENPFNPDEILVAEQFGCDILIINRRSGIHRVLYGERGVEGEGKLLHAPHSAHFMPSGPYKGHVLITEYKGDHRVMIIDRETGDVLWEYNGLPRPLDAIHWNDEQILVSDRSQGLFQVRLSDKRQIWDYRGNPKAIPFYLNKVPQNVDASCGGDLLIGYWGHDSGVCEIDTVNKTVAWEYGSCRKPGLEFYDKAGTTVCALRYGIREKQGGLTIIVDERSRIFCVNRGKNIIWELGGACPEDGAPATADVILPTYVSVTSRGTLLVTEWGRNMIYEINPFSIPKRLQKEGYFFRKFETTDTFTDSPIMESRSYKDKNIQIYNLHVTAALTWQILGSHNAEDWQVIVPAAKLEAGQADHVEVNAPWNFIKAQVKSANPGTPAIVDVFINMVR